MHKFGVQLSLEHVAEARAEWAEAQREFQAGLDKVMRVLIHEAVANFMSADDITRYSGLTKVRVRTIMRSLGLNQKDGKRVLSELASRALRENADLLNVDPNQIDLMSPLAYLPMGNALRLKIQEQRISRVDEFPKPVHAINYRDDEIGCGDNARVPILVTHDLDKITCPGCRAVLVKP